ncbi:MAG: BMC domain-containing protein [Kiritimatiellae bacterium]|nr:BMC domain-containing protein [Kiritimatiellia bacterium]
MSEKQQPALAAIEYKSVPAGIYAADALMKKSPISTLKAGTIGKGRYLVLFTGTTASVEESHQEGMFEGGLQVEDDVLLPDVHSALYAAVTDKPAAVGEGPLLVLETPTVSSCLGAVERVLKGVPVALVALRLGDPRMDGRGLAIFQGDLYDIEAAQQLAMEAAEAKGVAAQYRVLSAPTEGILKEIASDTRFEGAAELSLGGETAS